MAVSARQGVSVTTAATRLDADPTDAVSGDSVLLVAQATGTLVLGPSGVTSGNGCRIPVVSGTTLSFDLGPGEQLWGIVASGTLAIDVLISGS